MLVVIGTELDHAPRFWAKSDEWYVQEAKSIMVSYADFYKSRRKRKLAMDKGIREYLGVQSNMSVYLDNGSFAFWRKGLERPIEEYVEFVSIVRPDWYPVPADYIPHPQLSRREQKLLFHKTMKMNLKYADKGFVPVMHAGDWLEEYLQAFERHGLLSCDQVALGGLVPRLLSSKGSKSRREVVDAIRKVRDLFKGKLHVFGIGGLGTLHLASALKVDSIDSVGWRNRAARGLILLPGRGERSVVSLGNWRGVEVSEDEKLMIEQCQCPACRRFGLSGLQEWNSRGNKEGRGNGTSGFNKRAIHNLWTLLREAREVDERFERGEYGHWYRQHVSGNILIKLIEYSLNHTGNPIGEREQNEREQSQPIQSV